VARSSYNYTAWRQAGIEPNHLSYYVQKGSGLLSPRYPDQRGHQRGRTEESRAHGRLSRLKREKRVGSIQNAYKMQQGRR
jgi:hypothetical protein